LSGGVGGESNSPSIHAINQSSTSLGCDYLITQIIGTFLPMLSKNRLRITLPREGFFAVFTASYAANASSAFLANTLSPLVRDVGIDIKSSAFVVLNLFKVVRFNYYLLLSLTITLSNPVNPVIFKEPQ